MEMTAVDGGFDMRLGGLHVSPMANPATPRKEAAVLAEQARSQFGRRLQAWREFRDMTRKELSGATDLSDDAIRILEEGRAIPMKGEKGKKKKRGHSEDAPKRPTDPSFFSSVYRIALALGVTVDELFTRDPPPAGSAELKTDG